MRTRMASPFASAFVQPAPPESREGAVPPSEEEPVLFPTEERARRPMKQALPVMVVILLGIGLMGASAAVPWYHYDIGLNYTFLYMSVRMDVRADYSLSGTTSTVSTEGIFGEFSNTTTQSWDAYADNYKRSHGDEQPALPGVYQAALIFLATALASAGLGMLFIIRWLRKRSAVPALILVAVSLFTGLAAVGLFAAQHPAACNSDLGSLQEMGTPFKGPWSSFGGSDSRSGLTSNWGPGPGWFLALGGVISLALGILLLVRSQVKDKHEEYAPEPPRAQGPGWNTPRPVESVVQKVDVYLPTSPSTHPTASPRAGSSDLPVAEPVMAEVARSDAPSPGFSPASTGGEVEKGSGEAQAAPPPPEGR